VTARLEVKRLRVAYGGRQALDVEEFTAVSGELMVVLGSAGSGKSTLASALAGGVAARGQVRVDGKLLSGPPSQRRRQGLSAALREGGRLSGCTVVEALHLAGSRTGRDRQALDRFPQLGTRRRVLAQLLSGGEQQILRVATAWCAAPRVLVLDAPTVGLATDAAATVAALAREEAERGAAVLWLEQDRRAAPGPALATMEGGKLTAATPAPESPSGAG